MLRSKMPDGVIQEVYGYLCAQYAIRWLMHSAATDYGARSRQAVVHPISPGRPPNYRKPPRFSP